MALGLTWYWYWTNFTCCFFCFCHTFKFSPINGKKNIFVCHYTFYYTYYTFCLILYLTEKNVQYQYQFGNISNQCARVPSIDIKCLILTFIPFDITYGFPDIIINVAHQCLCMSSLFLMNIDFKWIISIVSVEFWIFYYFLIILCVFLCKYIYSHFIILLSRLKKSLLKQYVAY